MLELCNLFEMSQNATHLGADQSQQLAGAWCGQQLQGQQVRLLRIWTPPRPDHLHLSACNDRVVMPWCYSVVNASGDLDVKSA